MILLAFLLSAQDKQLMNPQDKQKFRELIQEGKGFHKFPKGPMSRAKMYKKFPWDKRSVDFLHEVLEM